VEISWLTDKSAVCLLEDNPLINTVIPMVDRHPYTLKQSSFDLIINLDDDETACELATTLQAKQLFGAYRKNGETSYTKDSSSWFDMSLISTLGKEEANRHKRVNQVSYPELLFQGLDISPSSPSLHLQATHLESAQTFATNYIEPDLPVIGLNTGAGSRWQFKQLGVRKTSELASRLSENGSREILLYGGPAEKERNAKIINGANCSIIDTQTTNSILEFAALINLADVLVTSDSLALHIASALEVATVVFFGPTSAAEIMLFSHGKKIVADMPCICCYKKVCDFSPSCMDAISIEDIKQSVDGLLKKLHL